MLTRSYRTPSKALIRPGVIRIYLPLSDRNVKFLYQGLQLATELDRLVSWQREPDTEVRGRWRVKRSLVIRGHGLV